jgi:hypothetical protein
MNFTEPVTFGFFWFSTIGRSAPMAGRSALGLGRCLLLHRTVGCVSFCFYSVYVRGTPLVLRTVRRKGPDGPRIGVFPKSFSCLE